MGRKRLRDERWWDGGQVRGGDRGDRWRRSHRAPKGPAGGSASDKAVGAISAQAIATPRRAGS